MRGKMENNNIIKGNPFLQNILYPKKTLEEVTKVAKQELGNITVNPFIDYLDNNSEVFNGNVTKQIRQYQAMLYNMGQLFREGQPKRTFDMDM